MRKVQIMGLISRIQGILLANAHHTIDRAENPEVIVKQVIRSLDQEVQNARVSVVKAVTSEKQLAAQVNRHRSEAFSLRACCLSHWRHALLSSIVIAFAAYMASLPPLPQDIGYHNFADTRRLLSVPNFFDVFSNILFLLIGLAGVIVCCVRPIGRSRAAWFTLFLGVALVSFGSAWYHWHPTNDSLIWDRLPMTIGFMGLFVALLGEYVGERFGATLLIPALMVGVASVLYWQRFDDLRIYYYVQLAPLLLIPVVMLLFRPAHSHQCLLVLALGCYLLAKISESVDQQLFAISAQSISGHTLKHILAALGCFSLLVMVAVREPLREEEPSAQQRADPQFGEYI
jgi:hypothetical protein